MKLRGRVRDWQGKAQLVIERLKVVADGERGVSATRRSPDEVRNLLSGFRAGQQRARTEEPVPTGSPEEKEPNE